MIVDYILEGIIYIVRGTLIGLGALFGIGTLGALVAVVWIIINERKERKKK